MLEYPDCPVLCLADSALCLDPVINITTSVTAIWSSGGCPANFPSVEGLGTLEVQGTTVSSILSG